MNPDPNGKSESITGLATRVERPDGVDDAERSADRPLGVILVRFGEPEVHKHPVAEVLCDVALELLDHLCTDALVGSHQLSELLGVEALGQDRRLHEVTEHDGKLAAFGLRPDLARGHWLSRNGSNRSSTGPTETLVGNDLTTTSLARHRAEHRAAGPAEARLRRVLRLAPDALHPRLLRVRTAGRIGNV